MSAINYKVSFPRAKEHYATVEIQFTNDQKRDHYDFVMPVWTPGSYKVREFAQNVEHFEAMGEKELRVDRIDKSTWRIQCKGEKEISVKYEVYCFVVSVRQSYVDQYHAFLHGVSVFGFLESEINSEIHLQIDPGQLYPQIEVALPHDKGGSGTYVAVNYDLLADSPIALGDFDQTA